MLYVKNKVRDGDVRIDGFHPCGGRIAQDQRAKIWQSIETKCDPALHVKKACEFAREWKEGIILPEDVKKALEWHSVTPIQSILRFWEDQKVYVRKLVREVERAPPNFAQQRSLSQINYRALTVIMREWDMGGENWLTQIRDGFPIIGQIRNAGVYPDVTDLPGKFVTEENCRILHKQGGLNWTESPKTIRTPR